MAVGRSVGASFYCCCPSKAHKRRPSLVWVVLTAAGGKEPSYALFIKFRIFAFIFTFHLHLHFSLLSSPSPTNTYKIALKGPIFQLYLILVI
jgi:hypothetical protein